MELLGTGSNILLIVLGFGLLIALHELGHFLAARWAGIRADGFAIGMGPVVASYRKGVGFRFGSCDEVVKARTGKLPIQLSDHELEEQGLGETEYSLRLLPIGGFVKMLGQEDGNPAATSEDPRSYGRTPVGKRMVVVSAGVIMNLITAIVMFVIAFMVGVRFEAPIVGAIAPGSPAAAATANGEGQDRIEPGDRVASIDGTPTLTFSDVMIESAMSVPGRPLDVTVDRPGREQPLVFTIEPEFDEATNMRMMGLLPASSTVLGSDPVLLPYLAEVVGERTAAELLGARITEVDGTPVDEWTQFDRLVDDASGSTVTVTFQPNSAGATPVVIPLEARPELESIPDPTSDRGSEQGLIGLVPLVRVEDVPAGGRNAEVLRSGDVVLRIADVSAPRMNEFRAAIQDRPGRTIPIVVLREGRQLELQVAVDGNGMIGVLPGAAIDVPRTANPIDAARMVATPIAPLRLLPGTTIIRVGDRPVSNWGDLRAGLLSATNEARNAGESTEVELAFLLPTEGAEPTVESIVLSAEDIEALHALGWSPPLPSNWFEPLQTTLTARGNPIEAVAMGFRQTWRMIELTYLTINRLVRGSVSVKQLHGPVGIVHIGTKVADRGMTYLLFFLAMISVNLAVLNFLPLPIVDGGLFLFLVYEKIRGRPPSIPFQNAAALVGLALIGTLFIVTFFNDLGRLFGVG